MNQLSPHANRIAPLLLLCPLLAVSDSLINALGLSVVAIFVTLTASLPMSLTMRRLPEYGRIAAVVIIAAGVVTSVQLFIHAWFYELYLAIGAYVPLLVAGGLMLTRYDVVTPRERRLSLILAGLRTGLKFAAALLALGTVREIVGHGSLLFGAHSLPGTWLDRFAVQFFHADLGFVLAILPPGAFIAMGVLFAARNWWRARQAQPNA